MTKDVFESKSKASRSPIDTKEIQESNEEGHAAESGTQPKVDQPVEQTNIIPIPSLHISNRVCIPLEFYRFHIKTEKDVLISDRTLASMDEPSNHREAMVGTEAAKWKESMESEIQPIYDNQVWNLVDPTCGIKNIGWKWIFKKKTDMDGNVHTFKSRLIAKGLTQIQGMNYEETFSPVAKNKSIRILLVIVTFYDYEIW